MKVSETIADAFMSLGTKTVFGVVGDGNYAWLSRLRTAGIEIVNARHEAASLAMAEAYAQVTDTIGVCFVTCGPGLAHLGTPLIAASRHRVPIVIFAGDTSVTNLGDAQLMDQKRFVEAVEAEYVRVGSSLTCVQDVQRGFYRAATGHRPVVISVPLDVQGQTYELSAPDLSLELARISPAPVSVPDAEAMTALRDLVAKSERPVLLAGKGTSIEAIPVLEELGESMGALLATTLNAKGAFTDQQYSVGIAGLFASEIGEELLSAADLVVAFGATLNSYTTESGLMFPDARVVSVNREASARGFNTPADLYLVGDVLETARAIAASLRDQPQKPRYRTPEVAAQLTAAAKGRPTLWQESTDGLLDPRDVIQVLDRHVGDDWHVALGTGHFMGFAISLLRRPVGARFLFTHAFGSIAYGLPTAIGAAVASRGPVIAIEGDGGLMMGIQELDTAARLGVKLLVFVINDGGYGAEVHKLVASQLDPDLAAIAAPALDGIARAFGMRGQTVTDLESLEAALSAFGSGEGPMLINVLVSPTILNFAYRKLLYGEANQAPHQGYSDPRQRHTPAM